VIRTANIGDTSRVVELMENSRAGAGFDTPDGMTGFTFPFVHEYARRLFLAHLESKDGCAIVHDVDGVAQGLLLAAAFEHAFGPVRLAKETLWWIEPSHRGGTAAVRMLDVYEAWAKERGCAYAGMAGMGDEPHVAKLYGRRKYIHVESHFLKTL
jgi:GNAT superfamily N-acetyltransferase